MKLLNRLANQNNSATEFGEEVSKRVKYFSAWRQEQTTQHLQQRNEDYFWWNLFGRELKSAHKQYLRLKITRLNSIAAARVKSLTKITSQEQCAKANNQNFNGSFQFQRLPSQKKREKKQTNGSETGVTQSRKTMIIVTAWAGQEWFQYKSV